jgi:hypothetical protein
MESLGKLGRNYLETGLLRKCRRRMTQLSLEMNVGNLVVIDAKERGILFRTKSISRKHPCCESNHIEEAKK